MATEAGTPSYQDKELRQKEVMESQHIMTEASIPKSEHDQLKNERIEKGQNRFLRHRNFIFQRIDIALVLANCYQIRTIISEPNKHEYYKIPLGFAIASICLQILFTILMVISWQADKKSIDSQGNIKKAESLIGKVSQFIAMLLVLFIVISNIVVVEFGAMTSNSKGNGTDLS
ncbi:uncharacterized protein LOC132751011 [Ruditapes philippinarum]|uniref:uncharacterized protein LOC132751011 n=1 Tax=Ruditapes philippinarum TaxID=129788 RepID=UPI00295AAB09|nr:uncharacterized protein LOC132751011 [Ruditapes philippinarum]